MRALSAMALCLIVLALSPEIAKSAPPRNPTEACALLEVTVGPFVMGSFCDPANIKISGWYVFALHGRHPWYDSESTAKSPGTDDSGYYLVGWFAVKRSTGSVHYFDIAEKKVGALFKKAK